MQPRNASGGGALTALVKELIDLKAVALETEFANSWLRPKLQKVISSNHELSQLLQKENFSWDASLQAFLHDHEHSTIDLVRLVSFLQKYLYERLPGQLGSGSYSTVYKARHRETHQLLAIKKLKQGPDGTQSGFTDSVIREISILRELKHANIVQLIDVISTVSGTGVYLVLECLDSDLRTYLQSFNIEPDMGLIKNIIHQVLEGVEYMHSHLILHRDLKPENILIRKQTSEVKLTDFGLSRQYLPSDQEYTSKVVTLYYRAPELLLGMPRYSSPVDMWSVGCIFAEMVNLEHLFRADNEYGLMLKILETLGTPTTEMWPSLHEAGYHVRLPCLEGKDLKEVCPRLAGDPLALDLLSSLLQYDPSRRMTARQALEHPWFNQMSSKQSQQQESF